ncbi:hypothetical protein [Actomonas aquatica]|uniref:Transporter suffix domain-containing protein n=1 Tax=Actomonas aquatica TaxID=2866162 RepID=A0ABZ1CB58_9BACT|nr:hypothetical protein [Opitutus sp. WL0086]WRQ87540.1 hypothetical protein K1X11_022215 [Opitutus sp. WL0086]
MRRRLHQHWQTFRAGTPGRRFRERYRRRARERKQGASQIGRVLLLAAAVLCILIAIPLMVLPGPAVVFYALAAFLIAGESIWVAILLDKTELLLRRWAERFRQWRTKS